MNIERQASLHERFDAARGLSALVVLADHSYLTLIARLCGQDSAVTLVASIAGRHAVAVFFLLSGHLITGSIRANVRRNGTFSVRDYLMSRVTRIYPPLIGSIALCILIWGVMFALDLPGARVPFGLPGDTFAVRERFTLPLNEIGQALRMQNALLQVNGPLWTLNIEVQMYVVAMAVGAWLHCDRFAVCWTTALALVAVSALVAQPVMAGIWVLGAASAILTRHRRAWFTLAGLAAIAILILEVRHTHIDGVLKEAASDYCVLAFSFIYVVILFVTKPRVKVPRTILSTSAWSYSLYIIHFPLLLLVLGLTQNWTGARLDRALIVWACAIPFVLVIAKYFAAIAENQNFFRRWLDEQLPSSPRMPVSL